MAQSWDKIFRQIALRANQLAANSTTSLATNYVVATIGDTQMGDRSIEFPKKAIDDAILNACGELIAVIGHSLHSTYRRFFVDDTVDWVHSTGYTAGTASGGAVGPLSGEKTHPTATFSSAGTSLTVTSAFFTRNHLGRRVTLTAGSLTTTLTICKIVSPTEITMHTSSGFQGSGATVKITAAPLVGISSRFFRCDDSTELEPKPLEAIRAFRDLAQGMIQFNERKMNYYHFDGERIYHTVSSSTVQGVYGEFVCWDSVGAAQSMDAATTRGDCPFPDDLHEAIVYGALANIFRSDFNLEQVRVWRQYFDNVLQQLAGGPPAIDDRS